MVSDDDLATMVRRAVITQVLTNYCRGIDRKDWDLARACFHADAVDSHGSVNGSVEDLIAWTMAKHERVLQSMHMLTNICFLEETASAVVTESYCSVHQTIERAGREPARLSVGCRYVDVFEDRDGGWRIASRTVAYEWVHHDQIAADLLAKDDSLARSPRDRTDPSYTVRAGS